MNYRIYQESDFITSKWTGGTTKQLAIFPQNAGYLDRNFIWRLSTAVCEQEETTFSRLPDYDRVLMVLSGSAVLAHQDVRVARLAPLEQDRFDGAYQTKSFGKITDYNLMVAKGNQGFLDVIQLEETSRKPQQQSYPEYSCHTVCLYCKEGFATVTAAGKMMMLSEGQQLVMDFDQEENSEISVMGEGILIRAQIFYHNRPEELGPMVIPSEKATFRDFKTCIYLANTQFHGARFIFRKMKNQWYDEQLSSAIQKLERFYLTFIVTLIGLCFVCWIGYGRFDAVGWVLSLTGWVLLDIFVVSPLIYLAVVPKPVHKHIKDVANLTPYEQKVRQRELETNERVEKILKKYKKSGRQVYDEDGNGIEDDRY